MNITTLGHVCIDENQVEGSSYVGAGSPAIFLNIIYKNFSDVSHTIISHRGKDFKSYSKDISILPIKEEFENNLIYKNIVKNNKRTQYALNRDSSPEVEISGEIKEVLKKTDILFVTPLLPNFSDDYLKRIISFCSERTLKLILPQGYFRNFDENEKVIFREFQEAEDILSLFDFVILSIEDYPNLVEISKNLSSKFLTRFIITEAEKGAIYVKNGETSLISTTPVEKIIDSTGAGDVFSAAFAYKYFQTKDEIESIQFAHTIAGISLAYTSKDLNDINLLNLLN